VESPRCYSNAFWGKVKSEAGPRSRGESEAVKERGGRERVCVCVGHEMASVLEGETRLSSFGSMSKRGRGG